MSGGRNFAPKVELSEAERLSDVERKYDVIRERIQLYDSIVQQFSAMKKHLEDFSKKDDLVKALEAQKKDLHSMFMANQAVVQGASERIGWSEADIRKLNKAVEDLRVLLGTSVQQLSGSIVEVDKKVPQAAVGKAEDKDLQEFKILYADQFHDLKRLMQAQDKVTEEMKQEVQALLEGLQDHNEKFVEQAKSTQAITIWLNSFEEKMQKKFTSLMEVWDANQKDFQEKVRKDLKTAKDEIVGTPSSNAAVEARIMNRLEMATLDGSNAVTVARNSAEKIKLLEKKIEGLTAQLQKYELPR